MHTIFTELPPAAHEERYCLSDLTLNGKPYQEVFPAAASGVLQSNYPWQYAALLKKMSSLQVGDDPRTPEHEEEMFRGPYQCDISLVEGGACIRFAAGNHTRFIEITRAQIEQWTGRRAELHEQTARNRRGEVRFKNSHDHHAVRAGCLDENAYFLDGTRQLKTLLEADGVMVAESTAQSLFGLLAAMTDKVMPRTVTTAETVATR